jgi:hypothetical protein
VIVVGYHNEAERKAMTSALRRSVMRAGAEYQPLSEFEFEQIDKIAEPCPLNIAPRDVARVARLHGELAESMPKLSQPSRRAEVSRLLDALHAELPRALKQSNRELPQEVDDYLAPFVRYFLWCGGKVTKGENSDCTRFVEAAASRKLKQAGWPVESTTIAHFVRRHLRKLKPSGVVTAEPDIGAPIVDVKSER